MVAGVTAAALVAPAFLIAAPASAAEADTTAPVIASITPGDGSFVKGTTTFTASLVEDNVSYSYLEFNKNGVWLTDDTKTPGSVKYGNTPSLPIDTTAYADGVYGVKVSTADKSGNKAGTSISVTVDNTAPVISTNLVDGQFVSGTSDIVVSVVEKNPTAYHAQLYRADGTAVTTVKGYLASPTGALTIPGVNWNALADGAYYLQVSARDKADNTASLKVRITRDGTRPDVVVTSPAEGEWRKASAPGTFDVAATDVSGLTGVVANLYNETNSTLLGALGRGATNPGTSWAGSFAIPAGLADGTYTVRTGTNDLAGNNKTVSTHFRIDGTAPVVTIDAPVAGASLRRTITVSGTAADAGSGIGEVVLHVRKVKENGSLDGFLNTVTVPVVDGAWTTTLDSKLFADGSYGITVLGTDNVGNANGGGSHVKPFVIDNGLPTLAITGPAAGATLVQGALGSASLTAGDGIALDRVAANLYDATNTTIVKNLGATSGSTALGSTAWTGSYALPADLAPGTYTIRASASDLAGNTTTVTSTFTVEAPPVVTPVADPPKVEPPAVQPQKPTLKGILSVIVTVVKQILKILF